MPAAKAESSAMCSWPCHNPLYAGSANADLVPLKYAVWFCTAAPAFRVPAPTIRLANGAVVPIPTLPFLSMRICSDVLVVNDI